MKLAILIPTTPDREHLYNRLLTELDRQIGDKKDEVIILSLLTKRTPTKHEPHLTGPSTGYKRNKLVEYAIKEGAYAISFHDSDDMPGPTYIQRGIEFMKSGMDCAELWGDIYWNGKKGKPFRHYLGCTHAWEDNVQYHRPANHLNFWKLDLVKDFKFQDKSFGEDMTWAMEIENAGIVKTMYPIPETIYHYFNGHPKHAL